MEWTIIDPDNLPNVEVLAANKSNDYLLGYVSKKLSEDIVCCSENEQLWHVTHYLIPTPPNTFE